MVKRTHGEKRHTIRGMGLARRKQEPCKRSVLRKSCTFIEIFFRNRLTKTRRDGKIYRQSAVAVKIESGRVPEWPMGTDCKSAAFSFGGSNPPAPTKRSSIRTGCWIFCFVETFSGLSGRIRTASARRTVRRAKKPQWGFFRCAARDSTRAHQEVQHPNRVLDFLFCRNFFRAERADSNSCGAVAEDSAKTARWAVFSSAARDIHPRPPRDPVSEPGTGFSVSWKLSQGRAGRRQM